MIYTQPKTFSEQKIYDEVVSKSINILDNFYKKMCYDTEELRKISYTSKRTGKNKGQYGYFVTNGSKASSLIKVIQELKIKSLCDLGAGAGILLQTLQQFSTCEKIIGYEIEDSLITLSKKYFDGRVIKKDLLKLTKRDLIEFDALYFWEPLESPELARKFVTQLEKSCKKGQYLIYNNSGSTGGILNASSKFTRLNDQYCFALYQKI